MIDPIISQGTDQSYLEKLHHELGRHQYFVKGADKRQWTVEFGKWNLHRIQLSFLPLLNHSIRCAPLCWASGVPGGEVSGEEQGRTAGNVL